MTLPTVPAMIFGATLFMWALVIALLLWRKHCKKQRRCVEVIRQRAHLKMVHFRETHTERTQMMNRSDLAH